MAKHKYVRKEYRNGKFRYYYDDYKKALSSKDERANFYKIAKGTNEPSLKESKVDRLYMEFFTNGAKKDANKSYSWVTRTDKNGHKYEIIEYKTPEQIAKDKLYAKQLSDALNDYKDSRTVKGKIHDLRDVSIQRKTDKKKYKNKKRDDYRKALSSKDERQAYIKKAMTSVENRSGSKNSYEAIQNKSEKEQYKIASKAHKIAKKNAKNKNRKKYYSMYVSNDSIGSSKSKYINEKSKSNNKRTSNYVDELDSLKKSYNRSTTPIGKLEDAHKVYKKYHPKHK